MKLLIKEKKIILTGFLWLAALIAWSAVPVIQKNSFPKEKLTDRITRITDQYNIHITYDPVALERVTAPEIKSIPEDVSEILTFSLAGTGYFLHKVSDRMYAINKDPSPRQSGSGTIKGKITDDNGEELPGATVRVIGSETGTAADLDGNYILRLPVGDYQLEASFIGYQTQKITDVKIVNGQTLTLNLVLGDASMQLDEVVISAIRKSRSTPPAASIQQITQEVKLANVVVSAISSEQISRSADRNAAQAVQRVAGVNIVDDKFVIVRGLNPRYNLTYLNDNVAPSTETNNRSFALDLIPSRVIDKILVIKSPSPENQADATGGVIKIYTKDAQAVRYFDVDFQLGVRAGTSFNRDFLTYNGGKFDFLGFDDGTRALPSSVPGYGSLHKAELTPSGYAEAFNSTLYYSKKTALPNMQLTLNYYDAFPVGRRVISSLTSFSYKNDNSKNEIFRQEGHDTRSVGSTDKTSYDDKNSNTAQLNLLQNFTYTLNGNSRFFFKNFLLQQGVDATVVRLSHPTHQSAQSASLNKDITLSYNQRFLYAGNLGGEHAFQQDKHQLKWNLGYNYSRQESPDQRVIRLISAQEGYIMGDPEIQWWARGFNPTSTEDLNTVPLSLGIISRLWSKNSEGVYNVALDYTFKPLKWAVVKAGTFHQWKKRELSRRIYTVHEGNVDPTVFVSAARNRNYVDINLIRFREQQLPGVWSSSYLNDELTGLHVVDRTAGADMYTGTEQNNSGYAALTLNPFQWIEVHGGIRYEYNRQKIAAAIPPRSTSSITINQPILVDNPQTLWLPSVNASIKPTDKWVFRAAYGQTVNRTEFREVSPFRELDFENNVELQGNPALVSAEVENYDLRLEFYPDIEKGDAVSVGVFYKDILNPIERINTSNRVEGMFPSISYSNADWAKVKGLEVELRKSFDFIPLGFFRNLSIAANGSLIESKVRHEMPVYGGSTKTVERSLQGQAPYLLNAGLYYDNAGWGTRAAVIYNYVGESIYAIGTGGGEYRTGGLVVGPSTRGGLIELPRQTVDFSYTQRIGKGMQVKFTVQNILDARVEMAEDANATHKYEPLVEMAVEPTPEWSFPIWYEGDNIASSYRPGRYFSLSFSYSF